MYDELVKRLRDAAKMSEALVVLLPYGEGNAMAKLYNEAADAIEELQKLTDAQLDIIKQYQVYLTKQQWIPVTERPPEEDCQVLAYYGFDRGDGSLGMMFMQVLDYYARCPAPHFLHEGLGGLKVTHWMPRPEPPKEEVR